ncbi:MAG: E3 binding domain-containing protein [Trueperaceae bacterium]
MSEPDIATLARRLAEQNNVDWRALSGSGPDGKIVERDVLDFLARVMAGDEALDPTPEPLPEGMEAWPDQDAPTYFKPNGAGQSTTTEGLLGAADESVDDLLADVTDDAFGAEAFEADVGAGGHVADAFTDPEPGAAFEPDADAAEDADEAEYTAVFGDATDDLSSDDDEELSDDIFLFDDDDAGVTGHDDDLDAAPFGELAGDAPQAESDFGLGTDAPAEADYAYEAQTEAAEEPEPAHAWGGAPEDVDDALLVADDGDGDEPGAGGGVAEWRQTEGDDLSYDLGASDGFAGDAPEPGLGDQADLAGTSLGGYDQEFTTPSEQFGNGDDDSDWTSGDLSGLGQANGDDAAVAEDGAGDLPDLWAGDAGGDQPDQAADHTEAFTGATDGASDWQQSDPWGQTAAAETQPDDADDLVSELADDVEDLVQAEALDEIDAVSDLEELDGQAEGAPVAAAFAGLPLVRTGNVMRRHVDLSALAGAQLEAGLELGHPEPLSAAPFLVRAVAKAVAELGTVQGQVALAELDGEVRFRRVDHAASRPFAELVEELTGEGHEEDELALVAVDLSGLDMDEVLLDLDVPAVTLGRILYDTQRGTHRSSLTLSGDLPLSEGSKLLARVAELLDAPVRLLV